MSAERDRVAWLLGLLGLGAAGNGVIMLFDTVRWFGALAATTGELNIHLVRDVGAAYVTVGAALLWAAASRPARLPLTCVAGVFLGIHALDHVFETATGQLPPQHWVEDTPGVYLPALLVIGLAIHFWRANRRRTP